MSWRLRLAQEVTDDASWQDRSIARFNLVSPFPEAHSDAIWKTYYEERSSFEPHQVTKEDPISLDSDHDAAPFKAVIRRKALRYLLVDARNDEEKETAKILNDGILCLAVEGGHGDDGPGIFRDADVSVRIYPRHTLTAVDAAVRYHSRERMSFVRSIFYQIMYAR